MTEFDLPFVDAQRGRDGRVRYYYFRRAGRRWRLPAIPLAEAGCSAHQIASITGHRSLSEIERYTRAADQKRMATAAIHRLERNGNRTATAKRPQPASAKREPNG